MRVLPLIQCKAACDKRNKVIQLVNFYLNSLKEIAKMRVEGQWISYSPVCRCGKMMREPSKGSVRCPSICVQVGLVKYIAYVQSDNNHAFGKYLTRVGYGKPNSRECLMNKMLGWETTNPTYTKNKRLLL